MSKLLRVAVVVSLSLLIGTFCANALGSPEMALPISIGLTAVSFIPVNSGPGVLVMAINAKNVLFPQGRFNPGGITGKVYYAFEEDILTWPAALLNIDTEAAVEFADLVTIPVADPFVFKPDKGFAELYVTLETGELKYSLIGGRDSKSFQNSMEVSYPGNDAIIIGMIASLANRRVVFAVKEQNNRIKILGTPQFPAQLDTSEGTSGKLIEDGNVSVNTFISKSPIPAPVYKPPLTLIV